MHWLVQSRGRQEVQDKITTRKAFTLAQDSSQGAEKNFILWPALAHKKYYHSFVSYLSSLNAGKHCKGQIKAHWLPFHLGRSLGAAPTFLRRKDSMKSPCLYVIEFVFRRRHCTLRESLWQESGMGKGPHNWTTLHPCSYNFTTFGFCGLNRAL